MIKISTAAQALAFGGLLLAIPPQDVSAAAQTSTESTGSTVPSPAAPSVSPPQSAVPIESATVTKAPQATPDHAAATPMLPRDLSPWAMFINADVVVKAVMLGLVFASLITWTIWLAKTLQLIGARHRAVRAVRALLQASSLADLDGAHPNGPFRGGPVAALVHAAGHEIERSARLPSDGIKERVAIALQRVEARSARAMSKGTGLVATIGSTAPFVGLFGTVWGIMNAFMGISQAHTTNLAVVAPGIAEALLATAIGLVAAIPAVIIYNSFARSISGYKALLSDASAEVMRHLSRDLDRRLHPAE